MRLTLFQGVMALFFCQSALLRPRPMRSEADSRREFTSSSRHTDRSESWNVQRLARLLHG